MIVDVYVAADDRYPRQRERWAGYLIKMGEHKRFAAFPIDETYHMANLIALVEALDRFNRPAEIVIHIQDFWVATMVEKNTETWQFNGWKNKKHKKIENWQYWQRAYNKLQVLKFNGEKPKFEQLTEEDYQDVMWYVRTQKRKGE